MSKDLDLKNRSFFFLVEVRSPEDELATEAEEKRTEAAVPCLEWRPPPLLSLQTSFLSSYENSSLHFAFLACIVNL